MITLLQRDTKYIYIHIIVMITLLQRDVRTTHSYSVLTVSSSPAEVSAGEGRGPSHLATSMSFVTS